MTQRTPEDEPTVHLSSLVDWLNEHTDTRNEKRARLDALLSRHPELADDSRITSKLGELAARGAVLDDFKGFLMGLAAEKSGKLDDEIASLLGEIDNPDNNIDKA